MRGMSRQLRVVLLGTGTSTGVPMIGCDCPVCCSEDPLDQRSRSSILVTVDDHPILIDTTPELRMQCVRNGVRRIEAVLFTHFHADHVVGLDDLRRFNDLQKRSLTCYGDAATVLGLRQMFSYAFEHLPNYPSTKPQLELQTIDGAFDVCGVPIIPIPLYHGPLPVLGFRFGPFAYCTDCSRIPDESMQLLKGVEILVIDGLRWRPHPTHFNIEQATDAARQIGARQTYFTHIAHDLPHAATNDSLPDGTALGYDGQIIELVWA